LSSSHKKTLFVTNLFKINIFWFSSITRLMQDLTRRVWYSIFFILDDIPHSSLDVVFLWRCDDNMSVIYWEMICAKILFYIYCFRVRHLYTWQHRQVTEMWPRFYWRQEPHSPQWVKSSQTTQHYIIKVIYKHFSCHHHIKKHFL
jgi:hypothetical protein